MPFLGELSETESQPAADDRFAAVVALIERQRAAGAEAVILGCTEITMLIDAACSPLPVFDTTALHAAAAVRWMFGDAITSTSH